MPPPLSSPRWSSGLSESEARARLLAEGYNELPRNDQRTPFRIVLEVLREPMLALLLVGGAVYLVLGDLTEALILIAFATLSVVITVVQETRTEKVLEALRDLTSPRALVIRGGERIRIAGREVVRGDCVVLAEGDRVPADARVMEANDLQTDESLLTGESVPVRKISWEEGGSLEIPRPGGDDLPYVFSGSLVVRGSGLAEVTATGPRSEIGRIGQTLKALELEPPRLQAETRRLVRVFGLVGGGVSILAVVLYGTLRGSWLDALLAGIALGMSMLPEEFPVVLTVFMAMGAWRISQARVLTRRAAAIETLGSATVLCTDKTGTLTENRMSIAELRLAGGETCRPADLKGEPPPEAFDELLSFGILSSARQPTDPMEKAFHALGEVHPRPSARRPAAESELVRTYGLRSQLLAMTHVWRIPGHARFVVAAKGAPEAVADLCHLGPEARGLLGQAVDQVASQGMRVLAVARSSFAAGPLPESQRDFDFSFLGLVGLADPLRAGVPEAVRACRSAGIRVVMITGDYPVTAQAIARQAGIGPVDAVITGSELRQLSDTDLQGRLKTTCIFARVVPEQKLRLIEAFQANGDVVAMTGDGVNDAPALKAADIGIAMGGRGTDVAREASALVLVDDDFDSIAQAVRFGRRIYRNILHAMSYLLAVHVPIAGMAFVPLLFGWPMAFFPVHIVFFEFVIDPACSIAFEADPLDDAAMRCPPRPPDAPLFDRATVIVSLLQGVGVLVAVAGVYGYALSTGDESEARAMAFATIVFGNLGLILACRSRTRFILSTLTDPNPAMWAIVAGTLGALFVVLYVPYWSTIFRMSALRADALLMCFAAAMAGVIVFEAYKFRFRNR